MSSRMIIKVRKGEEKDPYHHPYTNIGLDRKLARKLKCENEYIKIYKALISYVEK